MPQVRSFHYGWVVVATGSLVLFSCLGLARFAYTVILPGMQAGLGLTVDRMGLIGTANFAGYLAAVILSPILLRRLSPRLTIGAALLLIACCMIGMSRGEGFLPAAVLYTLVGLGSGFANIPMMALATYWFRSEQRGKAAGLMIAGNGVGIIFTGFIIPALNHANGAEGWRSGWLLLGLISLAVAALAALFLRNHPSDLGLEPVGHPAKVSAEAMRPHKGGGQGSVLMRLGVLYLIFGATFMVYGTFIVTTLVREYGFSVERAGFYWSWVGFFSLFSGVGFGWLSDRIGRKRGLMLVFAVQTAAYLLVGLRIGGGEGLVVSIVLYGLAVFAIPAIMAAAMGDYLGLSRAASAFATVTLFFAFGQTLGPAGAGLIAGATGTFTSAYQAASLLTLIAVFIAGSLPAPSRN